MNSTPDTYIGVLNFLTFGVSVIAAVLAIDMYGLIRVGEFGRTWRVLIVASVIFVLLQVLRLANSLLNVQIASELGQIAELVFAIAFAYAFYRQRVLYTGKLKRENPQDSEDEEQQEPDV